MSKWKHPYVIKVVPTTKGAYYHLMVLVHPTIEERPIIAKHYRFVESYDTLEKALAAKRKAYARLEK